MKKAVFGLLILVLAAGAYGGYPFWAATELAHAVATRDREALERHVDFPRVREGLRADLTARVLRETAGNIKGPGAGLAGAIVSLLAPSAVDVTVAGLTTPAGLVGLLTGRPESLLADANEIEATLRRNVRSAGFVALDRFRIAMRTESGSQDIRVVMAFSGLAWRVVGLQLPDEGLLLPPDDAEGPAPR